MFIKVDINPIMLEWAISRAGFDKDSFISQYPKLKVNDWITGKKKPTVKQLEEFSKKVYVPFGYFFLSTPPQEKPLIPLFRTNSDKPSDKINIHIQDIVSIIEQRQDWARNYLIDNGFLPLPFVGKFRDNNNIQEIVTDIRQTLKLSENWAKDLKNKDEAIDFLTNKIEEIGIFVVFNSTVRSNNHRIIPVEECRGFVLVDEYAPFIFINSADFKAGQLFTLIHELVHIWIGQSAAFDFAQLQPANNPIENLCNKVAAEFLVSEKEFNQIWNERPEDYQYASKYFKVSKIVIARRALDTKKITQQEFFDFYNKYTKEFVKNKKKSGGYYYSLAKKRISQKFLNYIYQAVKSEKLLYRDAYKLTGLKGNTFEKIFSKSL